ncbi:hypothetical protein [Sphaerisporangium fuscum]|uniref:hypothetical protein n=1 Tax=Sphaerisporangium fuscum TaxID=2835868 RepID=UPI001BDC8AD9|nr:hypothetical protein [Sphaerisporangium fuscum]
MIVDTGATGQFGRQVIEHSLQRGVPADQVVAAADLPAEQYRQILARTGLPGFVTGLIVDADVQVSNGALAGVTADLSGLLGRPTTPLSTVVAQALAA